MSFQITSESSKGSFDFIVEGVTRASMTFSKAGDHLIIIDHTEVDESLKGKGIGLQLVQEAIAWARTNNKKIIPLCPFAKSVFDKHAEFDDVLST
ncbi:MAG: GNAT family N-acetyltransferase [Chryseotalea sp.]